MKIAVVSDIHLEFGDLDFENTEGAEVLILSGDICVASDLDHNNIASNVTYRSTRYHGFFERCCENEDYQAYLDFYCESFF